MIFLYAIPSTFNLFLKSILIWKNRSFIHTSSFYFKTFFIGLWFLNLIELLSFFFSSSEEGFFWAISAYYLFVNVSLFSLLILTLESQIKTKQYIKIIILAVFLLLTIPTLIPGVVLAGSKSIGYSITRIPGPYYFIAQIAIILPVILSTFILFYQRNHKEEYTRERARILLIAGSPIFLSIISIVMLMQIGYAINTTIITSSMITITIFILIINERKYGYFQFIDRADVFKLTSLLPKTKDHQFVKNITHIVTNPDIGLSQGRELIEKEMIEEALSITEGNKEKAAKMLGISRQTLKRRLGK